MIHAVHHAVSRGLDRRENRVRLSQSSRKPTAVRWSAPTTRRGACGFTAGSLTIKFVPLNPMRSIFPWISRHGVSPASYTANRILDEPLLIVRTQGNADFTGQLPSSAPPVRVFTSEDA